MLLDNSNLELVKKRLEESISVKQKILGDEEMIHVISELANEITEVIRHGGKILVCGNGGSASDALHIVGELVGKFQIERNGYSAVALNADVATMTALANDYGYDYVFSKQVEALMSNNDLLIGISTSGNSQNVVKAFEKATEIGGRTALLSGKDGGKLKGMATYSIVVPSDITARIQEAHMCIYHIICEIVEKELSAK